MSSYAELIVSSDEESFSAKSFLYSEVMTGNRDKRFASPSTFKKLIVFSCTWPANKSTNLNYKFEFSQAPRR